MGSLANIYTILVAPKDSPAFAESNADNRTIFTERALHRGLIKAAELLQTP